VTQEGKGILNARVKVSRRIPPEPVTGPQKVHEAVWRPAELGVEKSGESKELRPDTEDQVRGKNETADLPILQPEL